MKLMKQYKLDCQLQKQIDYLDKERNVITSSTLKVSALTAEMKVVITFLGWKIGKMQQCTGDVVKSQKLLDPFSAFNKNSQTVQCQIPARQNSRG